MFKKGCYYLKERGLWKTAGLVFRFLLDGIHVLFFAAVFALLMPFRQKKLRAELAGRRVVVFTPTVEWNYLYQRAHQMAACYGAREDTRVLFLSPQRRYDHFFCCKQVGKGIYAINARAAKRLDSLTGDAAQVISCVYNITSAECLSLYRSDRIIYEYVDDLRFIVSKADNFEYYEKKHRELLARADLSVATANALYEEIRPLAKQAVLLPNAVDYDYFSAPAEELPELREKRAGYRCVLAYYGALASWFDYEAVRRSAEDHPDWMWLLIGAVIGDDLERSGVAALPNVTLVPAVPYRKLTAYIASADILTIPFVINDTTRATSPIKLFEYMAAQRPIITSDMPECRKYRSVLRYRSPEELEELVQKALELRGDAEYLETERREALENTWEARCRDELRALGME